jgi:hypothetical protein
VVPDPGVTTMPTDPNQNARIGSTAEAIANAPSRRPAHCARERASRGRSCASVRLTHACCAWSPKVTPEPGTHLGEAQGAKWCPDSGPTETWRTAKPAW